MYDMCSKAVIFVIIFVLVYFYAPRVLKQLFLTHFAPHSNGKETMIIFCI